MLKDEFYTISEMRSEGSSLRASLLLNTGHAIYQGHFPGRPVVPGVCMMQIIKELTELATGQALRLSRADRMKFLMPLNPHDGETLEAELTWQIPDDGSVRVSATLRKGTAPCFTFKGDFLFPGSGPLPAPDPAHL